MRTEARAGGTAIFRLPLREIENQRYFAGAGIDLF
jgi:hypothetical protein